MLGFRTVNAWIVEKHGGAEALLNKKLPDPSPKRMEARVNVRAVGLNHLDLWVRNGVPGHQFPLPLIPGCDVSGVIESFGEVSEDQRDKLKSEGIFPGARVVVDPMIPGEEFGLLGETQNGGCADFICVPIEMLVPISEKIDFKEAASLPIASITAWSMLTRRANLKKGQSILIQAGGSGVSVAAIQMAKSLGATVYTTVGDDSKAEKAKNLGADFVFNYKKTPFRKEVIQVLKERDERGLDVVLDHVGADTITDSLKLLKREGKLVTCGATSGAEVKVDLKLIFFKNLSILGNTMGKRGDLKEIVNLVEAKEFTPVIDSVFPMNALPKAYEKLESREVFGKVVLTGS